MVHMFLVDILFLSKSLSNSEINTNQPRLRKKKKIYCPTGIKPLSLSTIRETTLIAKVCSYQFGYRKPH